MKLYHLELWEKFLNILPTTNSNAAFGTPDIAFAIRKIAKEQSNSHGLIVMGGHKEGVISYGKDLKEAGELVLNLLNDL